MESAESDWTLISSRCPHWTISPHPKTRTEQNLEKVTDQRVYAVVDVTLSACLLMYQLCFVSSVFASSVDHDIPLLISPCMYACSCWMGNKGNIRVTLHWHAVSFDVKFSNRCFIFPALLGILRCRVALSLCDLVNTNTIICKHQFHCLHSKLTLKLALLFTKSIKTKIRTFKSVSRATGAVSTVCGAANNDFTTEKYRNSSLQYKRYFCQEQNNIFIGSYNVEAAIWLSFLHGKNLMKLVLNIKVM